MYWHNCALSQCQRCNAIATQAVGHHCRLMFQRFMFANAFVCAQLTCQNKIHGHQQKYAAQGGKVHSGNYYTTTVPQHWTN